VLESRWLHFRLTLKEYPYWQDFPLRSILRYNHNLRQLLDGDLVIIGNTRVVCFPSSDKGLRITKEWNQKEKKKNINPFG
jgi:hypothetical protein